MMRRVGFVGSEFACAHATREFHWESSRTRTSGHAVDSLTMPK